MKKKNTGSRLRKVVEDLAHGEHKPEEIYNLAQEPKKLIKQKGGDHPMSSKAHQKVFVREASLWFRQGLLK